MAAKRGSKWEATVHHHAYRAELAFLKADWKARQKHLARLYLLVPETAAGTTRMMQIVKKATLQAHQDFRES